MTKCHDFFEKNLALSVLIIYAPMNFTSDSMATLMAKSPNNGTHPLSLTRLKAVLDGKLEQ